MDDLERILSAEDSVEPSAGFTSVVMAAVHRQAAEPPLPFPWFRFAALLVACLVMAATGAVLLLRAETALASIPTALAPLLALAPELGYAAAVTLVGLGIAYLPRWLMRA